MLSLRQLSSSPLVRNSFVYVFCDGINKAIPFLLLPFITHYLTPSDYGIITNFTVYVQILSVFCFTCTVGAVPVMFYKLDKEGLKRYVSSIILLNTLSQLLCSVIAVSASFWIEKSLNLSFPFQLSAIVTVWFSGITYVNMVLWRCEEKPLAFGVYQISQSALNALTTILFVILMLLGWQGRIYSMILATVVFGLISIVVLIRRGYLSFAIDKRFVKQTLLFALPLVPHALSFWFKGGLDKVMLTNMVGLSSNGLYSVALTWGSIVTMFLTAFNNAYAPFLYKKLTAFDKDRQGTLNEQKRLVKLIWGIVLLTFLFIVLVYLLSHVLIKIIYAPSYYGSLEYLPWVMAAQFFQGGYLMFVCFAHYTFKTKILGLITFSLSILQVGITYQMILYCGPVGAAVSSALTSLMTFYFVARYAMKVYTLPWFNFLRNNE